MSQEQQHLDQANQHVREAEERIAKQEALVRQLAADGHDIRDAEALLQAFRDTLAGMKEHRDLIKTELKEMI